jgi:HPt (histidine-containing phosphotransfer) domain-containing protein
MQEFYSLLKKNRTIRPLFWQLLFVVPIFFIMVLLVFLNSQKIEIILLTFGLSLTTALIITLVCFDRMYIREYKAVLAEIQKAEKSLREARNVEIDIEFQKALQILFVKNNREKYNDIIKALQEKDIKLAHRLVHDLRSNAGQLGRISLQQAAADMEQQLRTGESLVTEEQMRILNLELSTFLNELSPLLDEDASNKEAYLEPILRPEDVQELFEKLEPLLRSGNPESLDLIDDLRAITGSEMLIQQIEDFEFEAAHSTFAELKERTVKNG